MAEWLEGCVLLHLPFTLVLAAMRGSAVHGDADVVATCDWHEHTRVAIDVTALIQNTTTIRTIRERAEETLVGGVCLCGVCVCFVVVAALCVLCTRSISF